MEGIKFEETDAFPKCYRVKQRMGNLKNGEQLFFQKPPLRQAKVHRRIPDSKSLRGRKLTGNDKWKRRATSINVKLND